MTITQEYDHRTGHRYFLATQRDAGGKLHMAESASLSAAGILCAISVGMPPHVAEAEADRALVRNIQDGGF